MPLLFGYLLTRDSYYTTGQRGQNDTNPPILPGDPIPAIGDPFRDWNGRMRINGAPLGVGLWRRMVGPSSSPEGVRRSSFGSSLAGSHSKIPVMSGGLHDIRCLLGQNKPT